MDSAPNSQTSAPPRGSSTNAPRLTRLADLLDDWQAYAESAHDAYTNGTPRGAVTGFATLDRELGGALEPGVHVVLGAPGTGKSAFVLQAAAEAGCPALLVTCEMSPLELLRRHTARVTGTYLGRLKTGELSPAGSLALVKQAITAAPNLYLADATTAFARPDWIDERAQEIRGNGPHVLVVIDSVHSWAEKGPSGFSEYDLLNAALAELRGMADELAAPILVVSERNRMSMTKGGLSSGAGSRKIEYGGSTVLDLQRDKDDVLNAAGEVSVTLRIEKNRNGAAGKTVKLCFIGALQRFVEA
jgi:replicative DNA helicase